MGQGKFSVGTFVRLRTDPARAGLVMAGEFEQADQIFVPFAFPAGPSQCFLKPLWKKSQLNLRRLLNAFPKAVLYLQIGCVEHYPDFVLPVDSRK